MRLFTRAPIDTMTDAALDAIAADEVQRQAALAERERRTEAKRQAEVAAEAAEAEREKTAKIDALSALATSTLAEARREHGDFCDSVFAAASSLERRAALVIRLRGVTDELERLGVSSAAPTFENPAGLTDAALRIGYCLAEIIAGADTVFTGTTGDILARAYVGR